MLARLVNGLEPHPPPLSTQKNEMLIFGLRSTSDDWPGWSMDWNSLCHPSPAKNMKCYFLDYVQLLMIGWAGQWTQTPSATPLQPKKWNAHFCITFNIWCWPDWSMDLNLIHHSSAAKNMKCSFLGYIQLLVISWAVRWTQTPSATPLQPIKWNAHFWITFNFWWSAGLVNGLEPHPPPVSRQKNEMLIFWLCSTSDVGQTGQWTQTPSTTPLQPIKWNASFWIMFTSDDQLGWLMDSNPICHPSPDKKWNAHILIMFNFWWLARLVTGLEPHPPLLSSQKKWNTHFWIMFPSDDLPGWLMNLNLICHPSPPIKMKSSIFDYVLLLMISQAGQLTQSPSASPLQPIKWNASFWIMFTSDDQPGWLMDSNPICHPSPAKKMKCSLLDYVHFGWSARLVDGLKPHPSPLSSQ